MLIKTVALCFILSATLSGPRQSPPTIPAITGCPVEFVSINPTGDDSFGHAFGKPNAHANDGRMFVLKLKNSSGKDIKGMKFQAAFLDATEDSTDIPVAWNWTDPLKAGDEKSFRWENAWKDESKVGWNVRLTKLLYADGSKWEPSDAQSCVGSYRRDKKHPAS